jgi:glycosyltransferase involved in cell wall biosynthesis
MDNYPTISIITPSLNHGLFIEKTLNSILLQKGNFYLDVIVIDGCSIDDSIEVIKKYKLLLETGSLPVRCRGVEYRWVSELDSGQAAAINKGLRIARGDIVTWLNSDDKYSQNAIQSITEAFSYLGKPCAVYGHLNIINEQDKVTGCFKARPYEGIDKLIESCWNTRASFLVQPAVFFKKECIQSCGLLDESLDAIFDYDLFIRVAREFQFVYIDKLLAEFRIYPASKTGYSDARYIWERVYVSRKYLNLLPSNAQTRLKSESTDFLIARLWSRLRQAVKTRDFAQVRKCTVYLIKSLRLIFFDSGISYSALRQFGRFIKSILRLRS